MSSAIKDRKASKFFITCGIVSLLLLSRHFFIGASVFSGRLISFFYIGNAVSFGIQITESAIVGKRDRFFFSFLYRKLWKFCRFVVDIATAPGKSIIQREAASLSLAL